MRLERIGFIGLGLIGGSIAKTIRRLHPAISLVAYDPNRDVLSQAMEDGVLDEAFGVPDDRFRACNYIFLCAPVHKNTDFLHMLSDFAGKSCIVTDVGSVKTGIQEEIASMPLARYFIGGHPMAGSEMTGYGHSSAYLLENAYYILTPNEKTDAAALADLRQFIQSLGAIPLILGYQEHDYVTAAVSHLPHVLASCLVNLVKRLDGEDETMKRIAAGGFKDITRIASSSPSMWQQICLANQTQLLKLLDEFLDSMRQARDRIAASDGDYLREFFLSAKDYRDSISLTGSGPLPKIYDVFCDMKDEAGEIAALATILALNNISIKNIGIIHNREFQEGALHIEFYEEEALNHALKLLKNHHYTVYER